MAVQVSLQFFARLHWTNGLRDVGDESEGNEAGGGLQQSVRGSEDLRPRTLIDRKYSMLLNTKRSSSAFCLPRRGEQR